MDKSDLEALLVGASAEEVDRIHRLLHEWNVGPDSSFPVQLALLTRTQLRAAASVPRSINDSRKWLEQHLVEYRRQTVDLVKGFEDTMDKQASNLKEIISKHNESVKHDSWFVRSRLTEADEASKRIRDNLQFAVSEWNQSKDALARERQRFEKVCKQLDDGINLRGVHWYIVGTLAACVVALLIGHYVWHP